MNEGTLQIIENGQYKNVSLTTKYKRQGLKLILDENGQKQVKQQGLNNGESITLVKKFAEGKPLETKYGTSYLCAATYDGVDVSFWLKPQQHEKYAMVGGEGDSVRVTNNQVTKTHPTLGIPITYDNLEFEKVE